MKKRLRIKKQIKLQQAIRGFLLVEALVSVLIFALGVMALIGAQANTLILTSDIQTRAEIAHFADAYLGRMWGAGLNVAQLRERFGSGAGAEFDEFRTKVQSAIPQAQAPVIIVQPNAALSNSAQVTIFVQWQDTKGTSHNYTEVASIGY